LFRWPGGLVLHEKGRLLKIFCFQAHGASLPSMRLNRPNSQRWFLTRDIGPSGGGAGNPVRLPVAAQQIRFRVINRLRAQLLADFAALDRGRTTAAPKPHRYGHRTDGWDPMHR
jgi:hypothetical protein